MADCAYSFCVNHIDRINEDVPSELRDVTYHSFPKDITQREKWLKQMNQEDWKPVATSALCSLHFNKDYFTTTEDGTLALNDDAIPTEFEITNLMDKEGDTIEAPVTCCAFKCGNTYSPESSITFHAFPVDQPELCAQWLTAMNCTQLDDAQAVLCSEHFDDSCFVISEDNERLLIADAVPSSFLFASSPDIPMEEDEEPQADLGSFKFEITEEELALIRRHDGVIQTLLQTQNKYVDINAKRIRLERQKKNLDFLLRAALCNTPIEKSQVKGLKSLLKVADGKYQEILVRCLEPCIVSTIDVEQQLAEC